MRGLRVCANFGDLSDLGMSAMECCRLSWLSPWRGKVYPSVRKWEWIRRMLTIG